MMTSELDGPTRIESDTPPRAIEIGILVVVAGLIMLLGLRLILGPEERLAHLFYDDAYYYLGVAQHMALGHGSTFDGINPTNGYHPLYCWLLVPVLWFFDTPGSALRASGLLWFALAAASPIAIWWSLRRRTGASGALVAAMLFGLHPVLGLHLVRPSGLETPLYALLIALVVGVYERTLDTSVNGRKVAWLGLLLGLVILARLDAGMLAVAMAVLLGLEVRRRDGWAAAVRSVIILTAVATLVAGPSLIWNTVAFGSPVPVSERVVSVYQGPAREALGAPFGSPFLESRVRYAAQEIPLLLGRYALGSSPPGMMLGNSGRVGAVVILSLFAAIFGFVVHARKRWWPLTADSVGLLSLFVGLHYLVYASWFWTGGEVLFRLYYFMPEWLLMAVLIGACMGAVLARRPRLRRLQSAVLLATLAATTVALFVSVERWLSDVPSEPGPVVHRGIYGWIKENLPRDAVLGARGSGRLGFFSGRTVVNLDGLINDQRYLEALRTDKVDDYVLRSPIEYLVGLEPMLHEFDPSNPTVPPSTRLDLGEVLFRLASRHHCELQRMPGTPGTWFVVRIGRPAASSSASLGLAGQSP